MTSRHPPERRLLVEGLEPRRLLTSLPFDGHGLTAEYFSSDDLAPAQFAVTRIDPTVNFDWGVGSPDRALSSGDGFSARWSGTITARFDEPHTFLVQTGADEGARLWIDNTLLIDTWDSPSATEQTAIETLVAGRAHDFMLEYKEGVDSARLVVRWFSASSLKEILPREQLRPSRPSEATGTLLREYWTGIPGSQIDDLTAAAAFQANLPTGAEAVDQLDVPPGSGPGTGDEYGQRIRGYLIAPESGYYTFYVAGDEDTRLRLSNDATPDNAQTVAETQGSTGYQEFDEFASQRSSPVYLVAAERYYLETLHKEGAGGDHLSVAWTRPGQSDDQRAILSGEHLDIFRPRVAIHAERSSLSEAALSQSARFAVSRSDDLGRDLTVAYTVGGTATSGEDYEPLGGLVTIPAGQKTASLEVRPLADGTVDGNETVVVRLNPSADRQYWLGSESTLTATATFENDPAGIDLLPPDSLLLPSIPEKHGDGTYATFENFSPGDPDLPFNHALRLTVHSVPTNHWDVRPIWHIDHQAVNTGDNLLITMYLRSGQVGQTAEVALHFRRGNGGETRVNRRYTVGDEWELITLAFDAPPDDAAQLTRFDIRAGWALQTVDIGGLRVLNYGANDPPSGRASYAGREVDAPWRAAAEERIEQTRKDLLEIFVRDELGNPIEGAVVGMRLREHSFGFGDKIHSEYLSPTYGARYNTADGQRFRSLVPRLFNSVEDNTVNWQPWLNNPGLATEMVQFANDHGLPFRGHNIIWGEMEGYPAPGWLNPTYQSILANEGATAARQWLEQTLLDHIVNDAPGTLSGMIADSNVPKIAEWSVINHPIHSPDIWDIVGQGFMIDVLDQTRAVVHPDTKLFINEDAIITGRNYVDKDAFYNLVDMLVTGGAELDGVAFQSHFGSWVLPGIEDVLNEMNRFAAFGLDLMSSEFDVDNTMIDDQTQADFTRDFIHLALSHPQMLGVVLFGVWEGRLWRADEGAHLFNLDWSVKPNGQTWMDLVGCELTTRARGTTRGDGRYAVRGYHGEYEVVVEVDGIARTYSAVLEPGGSTAALTHVFQVASVEHDTSGVAIRFTRDPDLALLNLYDGAGSGIEPPDVSLVGQNGGNVAGSLVWDDAGRTLRFIKTGGPLPSDVYTLTLASRADGVVDLNGVRLDGDGDGVPGGDYVTTLTVVQEPVVVALPDFSRGPGQAVKVPAAHPGLPVTLNEADGVRTVVMTIEYDPALLTVTGALPGPDATPRAGVITDLSIPGKAILSFGDIIPLRAGPAEFITLIAEVPNSAPYGDCHLVEITAVIVNGGTVAATADDAVHSVSYFGDVTGNGTYSGLDAQRVARVAVGLGTGLRAYPVLDPVIVADITGNGALSGLDAQRIAQYAVGLSPSEIPPLTQPARLDEKSSRSRQTLAVTALGGPRSGGTLLARADDNVFFVDTSLPIGRPHITSPAERGRSPSQRREGATSSAIWPLSHDANEPSPGSENPTFPKGRGDNDFDQDPFDDLEFQNLSIDRTTIDADTVDKVFAATSLHVPR